MPQKLKARRVKANPGKPGAPTVYTPQTVRLLCAAYSTGVSLKDAAQAAGIGETTVRDWLKESDAHPQGPKGEFRRMLEVAFSKAVVESAHQKRKADPGWWLSRMRPKRFGDPTRKVEVSLGTTDAMDDGIKLARELLKNDAAREQLEAVARTVFGAVEAQPGDVRAEVEPGPLED